MCRRAGDRGLLGLVAVFAELQTRGRGRAGRQWQVPSGRGVLCSTLWRPPVPPERAATLVQVAGVAATTALAAAGIGGDLKWPNDLLVDGAKVGGILLESAIEDGRLAHATIGIGLNVNQVARDMPDTPYPATSLALASGRFHDRTAIAASLLGALAHDYERWLARPVEIFERWRARLATLGHDVAVTTPGRTLHGRAREVELDGTLVLELPDGRVERLISGELSVRG